MKVLLLMPCDEKNIYEAQAIYNKLEDEVKSYTFAMPCFMEYLMVTKKTGNWISAFFYTLIAAKEIYKATKSEENLIIIGNLPKEFHFDNIFNFQSAEESLPYEDKFIEKIKEIVNEEEVLSSKINNLYTDEDSIYSFKNCAATASFLNKFIKTDKASQIEKINKAINEYQERIERKNVYGYNKDIRK